MTEIWKDIPEYKGYYQVSNKGRVKSLPRIILRKDGKPYTVSERMIKAHTDKDGYLRIELNKVGQGSKFYVHRLVGLAFIPNLDEKPQINHIDADKKNNNVHNLEWVTLQENRDHAVENGLQPDQSGKNNPNIKLSELDVQVVRKLGRLDKTRKEISEMVGTSVSNVNNILGGYTWKWLKEE